MFTINDFCESDSILILRALQCGYCSLSVFPYLRYKIALFRDIRLATYPNSAK